MTPSTMALVATIAGYLLATARLFNVLKPLYGWLPTQAQPVVIALVAGLPQLADALLGAKSSEQVLLSVAAAVTAFLVAVKGKPHDPTGGDGSAVGPSKPMFPPASVRPPGGFDAPMSALRLALVALGLGLLLQGCAAWKPIARTADGVAETLCAQYFGEKQQLSLEDAARQFCATRSDLEPWLDAVLAAKRSAGPKAAALHP
jgi:hypothetical protein